MVPFIVHLSIKLASAIKHINAGAALKLVLGRLRVEVYWIVFIYRPAT